MDLSTRREQLAAAKEQTKTCVLSLRSCPTSDYEAIKRAMLEELQKENKGLLATLRRAQGGDGKRARVGVTRGSKSQEFKETIFSALWSTVQITFIPNRKMQEESKFHPSQSDENSIVFDGEKDMMKGGGGPNSALARKIGDHIWLFLRNSVC
ncbi:hypothetical protein TrVFT333_010959 [Trichoderma virens FT-333]|nr:hypothetical protein TrVFT333_010959 [Trichoderma virens FT-333]